MAVTTVSACALAACGKGSDHPPTLRDTDAAPATTGPRQVCVDDAAPPSPNAQGFCGNTFLEATSDHPNLYFVIDRSGSMLDVVDGQQKYAAVARAAASLVRSLGPRANVGAALFPGNEASELHPCAVGNEVFPTRPGDALPSGACGDGPVTASFAAAIGTARAFGSTPTGATLRALLPTLAGLSGKTVVILATDGGPNCNDSTQCDAAGCIPNIEKQCQPAGANCCSAAMFGPTACLDGDATRDAVADLFAHQIPTYVIGIPGSAPYAAVLDGFAMAGGTARPMEPAYYDVEHLDELDGLLASIGTKVVLSCHLRLESAPPDRALVNVYLDRDLLSYGSADGWRWSDDADGGLGIGADDEDSGDAAGASLDDASAVDGGDLELDLLGAACDKLSAGQVQQVQIVFGCKTAIIR